MESVSQPRATCLPVQYLFSARPLPASSAFGVELMRGAVNRANVLSAETLASFPRLVGVSIVGVGYDAVDVAACRERRIAVMSESASARP